MRIWFVGKVFNTFSNNNNISRWAMRQLIVVGVSFAVGTTALADYHCVVSNPGN
jgi:hypothetical protein